MANLYMNYMEEEKFIKCMKQKSILSNSKNKPCTSEAQKWSNGQQRTLNELRSNANHIMR